MLQCGLHIIRIHRRRESKHSPEAADAALANPHLGLLGQRGRLFLPLDIGLVGRRLLGVFSRLLGLNICSRSRSLPLGGLGGLGGSRAFNTAGNRHRLAVGKLDVDGALIAEARELALEDVFGGGFLDVEVWSEGFLGGLGLGLGLVTVDEGAEDGVVEGREECRHCRCVLVVLRSVVCFVMFGWRDAFGEDRRRDGEKHWLFILGFVTHLELRKAVVE